MKRFELNRGEWKRMHARNSSRVLLQTIVILLTVATLVFALSQTSNYLVKFVCSFFIGVIFVGWFSAIHECVHGLFFKNKKLNRAMGVFWSCPTLLNFSLYRYYHLEHHRHTAVDGDPEPKGEFKNLGSYLLALTTIWFPIRFLKQTYSAFYGSFPDYVKSKHHKSAVTLDGYCLIFWILLIGNASVMFPVFFLFAYWIPLLIYFVMLSITGLPEHYGCDEVDDVTRNTRSIKSNRIFRYFYWNNNFHAEHHAFPQVPFFNLPQLNDSIGSEFKHKSSSYIRFHFDLILSFFSKKK